MLIIFYLLLMLRVGRCRADQNVKTKTAGVGADVKLTCNPESWGTLIWVRVVSGKLPEVLGKTFSSEGVDARITATEEHREFVLRIKGAKLSDTGAYYCMKTHNSMFTFMKGVELTVEGVGPDITAVPPSPSAPVRPADSVTLQCSVLSDSENKTCPGDHSVFCFTAGSDESHPSFNHIQGNKYDKNPVELSTKKCVYSFFKNVSSSDAGAYYCTVTTCEEIFCGNRSKPEIEDSQTDRTILSLLCAALTISLILVAFLMYSVKKLKNKPCGCCNAAVVLQMNAATAAVDHQNQQTDEDSLIYSAPNFTKRTSGTAERRDAKTEEEESIYSDVRANPRLD